MSVRFRLELVGGPFDGTAGLVWVGWPEVPVPDRIEVGVCSGAEECGMPSCRGREHVAYWVEELEPVPSLATVGYVKEQEFVSQDAGGYGGLARFVVVGLDMFGRLEERELVGGGVFAEGERMMAKPGSNGARRIASAGAVDLTRATLGEQEAREVQEMLEHKLLARCNGCGRRITIGFRCTSIDPRSDRPVVQLAACTRDDCDYAERLRDGAVLMEMVEFAWLDENGPDAPASLGVVRRNEQLAAQEPADGGGSPE